MKLEEQIRAAEAGPWLDALCAVAMGWNGPAEHLKIELKINEKEIARIGVSRSWSAAGPALEWVASLPWVALWFTEYHPGHGWRATCQSISGCTVAHVLASVPCLAIARAVALVGVQENTEAMEAAAAALEKKP